MRQSAVPPPAGATPAGTRARVPLSLKVVLSAALLFATALLAVVGWRVLDFWLPIPLGLAAYVSLRFGVLRRRPAVP